MEKTNVITLKKDSVFALMHSHIMLSMLAMQRNVPIPNKKIMSIDKVTDILNDEQLEEFDKFAKANYAKFIKGPLHEQN